MVLIINGRLAIVASCVINCGPTGVFAGITVTSAAVTIVVIITVIAGSGTGSVATATGVVRSTTVDVQEVVGYAAANGDVAVLVGVSGVRGTANVIAGAVSLIVGNVVN